MPTYLRRMESGAAGTNQPVLLLPLDFARHKRTYDFTCLEYPLEEKLCRTLAQASWEAKEEESFLMAVYFAWIYRLSGENEMLAELISRDGVGTPVLVSLESEKTFKSLQNAVSRNLETAYRSNGGEYETRFAVRQTIKAERELLNWQLLEEGNRWSIHVEFDTSLFKAETISRYVRYFIALLEAALADASARITAVDILTEEDQAVYEGLNATEGEYAVDQTVHGMVEQAAVRYPEHIAVSSVEGALTYRELNEKANQTARMLLEKGLKKGDFVTILMERSLDLVVSLLGILKAGGAYVPVDPEHPEERNRYIVEDTKSAFVLTKSRYLQNAEELCSGITTVKEIISVESGLEQYPGALNPETGVTTDDLAYIIYTSGSTGRPKGALIAHRGVVNLGEVVRRDCGIEPADVLTQFATYSFDASVWDTIGALFYGAHLYLLSPEERVSVEEFASAIERTGTTIITILPTVFFNQLAAYLSDEGYRKLSKVKLITVAGEALYGEQVRAFQRKFQDRIDIVNVYGPTECTVCTTTHKISGYIPDELTNVPIGKPIQNYKVYIVNEENRLCPLHVGGEVVIETIGLAKGYLNQPGKTAEAFVPNPFTGEGLIYKSGDIAKLLPDGTIEYVGRRDSQIKIRGHRIEIGEIEDNFAKIANVQNVAVIPKKDKDGQNMLVGYFTSKDGNRISAGGIKQTLGDKLPSYFVPKWIVQLEEMPISPTGKIDRKKLAGYEHHEEPEVSLDFVEPQTETQELIAAAWRDGLDLERVSIHDDFFAVGGDSLAIIHLLVILKPHYPGLKINDFFQYRTIEQLAKRAEQLRWETNEVQQIVPEGTIHSLEEHPAVFGNQVPQEKHDSKPSAVLLTGTTGYLGSYLLHELLTQSEAEIYCLVRKSGKESGLARLQDTMTQYFGPAEVNRMNGRVFVVEGDLSKPGLGLSRQDEELLKEKLDAILHSAADVRHFGDAEQFDKTNVNGTRYLVELAAGAKRNVRFHHISTLGIPEDLALSGQWEKVLEKPEFDPDLQVDNLYTNSKLEAEKLLFAAAKQGVDVSIYRVGNLSCHSQSGSFQKNIDSNAFYRMIKAMLLLGKAPKVNWEVDFTPIDYASQSIVHMALRPEAAGRVFHICNPKQIPYSKMVEMIRGYGYLVETMEFAAYSRWVLDKNVYKDPDAMKLAMAQLEGDGAKNSNYRYGCPATTAFLNGSGVRCAEADESFIRKMLDHAVAIGYFPKPNVPQLESLAGRAV